MDNPSDPFDLPTLPEIPNYEMWGNMQKVPSKAEFFESFRPNLPPVQGETYFHPPKADGYSYDMDFGFDTSLMSLNSMDHFHSPVMPITEPDFVDV